MTITMKKKDVVIIGLGWTGAILGIELAQEGLEILALERGEDRDTVPQWAYPKPADELKYGLRYDNMVRPADWTISIRRSLTDKAEPYRQLGSFLPGNGVGGAGMHWNGQNWRAHPQELRLRSYVQENFGNIIPDNMTIEDWGVSYEELEPFYDYFEKVAGVSGYAGNLNGEIREGGNPFEGPRNNDYPMAPLDLTYNGRLFTQGAKSLGLHPFPFPSAIASRSYTNPYGMQMGSCNYCGFCERYGCLNYSKASPQLAILAALKQYKNFEYRTKSDVIRINKAADGKTVTGVTYVNEQGEEVFQPADLVILAGFQLTNVHMLLVSEIGTPYNPETGEGVVGKNYAYQTTGGGSKLFFKDKVFNPFIGHGANGAVIDDFGTANIDFAKEGFIGGSYISSSQTNGQPIHSTSLPKGTPAWGAGWKKAMGDWYGHSMGIGHHGTNMSYRDSYLDLDPTYKDKYGRPLMRMTFNWHDNDILMAQFMARQMDKIAHAIGADQIETSQMEIGQPYDVRPYQSTHTVGGAIMGTDPKKSVLNRYLQHWDAHNLFVTGASAFPQNIEYNPTGTVGALAYWLAHALRTNYLKNPRPLV
ncbi:GMC family oxidoreductase [Bartonella sp. HY406]|uniref:GMC family oxidoreductase n=1 Tax=Bartonella sp. HY406 TaxID=2979331 RepID=UPI0021C8F97D|nr:GMC family oxidoreductase [Bartonella sp. HY406]UXN02931.1 GMC family oxidoreductase [Bartonella sp. HY406]